MQTSNSAKTLDFFATFMSSADEDPGLQLREAQYAYESVVVSNNGRIRNSRYSQIAEMARQGDLNALTFLAFLTTQLDARDRNRNHKITTQPIVHEYEFTGQRRPYQENGRSPMAKKLRSQYGQELDGVAERLQELHVDDLWNEILMYARMGFASLRNSKSQAMEAYQLPKIEEAPAAIFLRLPLASAVSRQPLILRGHDVNYLDNGRQIAESGRYMGAGYAAILIENAGFAMEQIAMIHGVDISDRVEREKLFIEKLRGGTLIQDFEWSGGEKLVELAREGKAVEVFRELQSLTRESGKYHVPLDLLITSPDIGLLKTSAVNHPEMGLRGELLEIARDIVSGDTWRRIYLTSTDELVPFCNNQPLVAAYSNIRAAIETLADAAYRQKSVEIRRTLPVSHKPAGDLTQASARLEESMPFNPRFADTLNPKRTDMALEDARAILAMLESGDLEGIINYNVPASASFHVLPYAGKEQRLGTGNLKKMSDYGAPASASYTETPLTDREKRKVAGMLAAMGGLAAIIAGMGILATQNQGRQIQRAQIQVQDYVTIREIDCSGILIQYEQNTGQVSSGQGPVLVCKPGTATMPISDILLPNLADSSSGTIAGERSYRAVSGDNLTRIMKRRAGITNDRQAYLEALSYAESHGIKPPYIIHPGQIITIRNR